jgi:hypothetical protein
MIALAKTGIGGRRRAQPGRLAIMEAKSTVEVRGNLEAVARIRRAWLL